MTKINIKTNMEVLNLCLEEYQEEMVLAEVLELIMVGVVQPPPEEIDVDNYD